MLTVGSLSEDGYVGTVVATAVDSSNSPGYAEGPFRKFL